MYEKFNLSDLDRAILEGMKLGVFDDFYGQNLLRLYYYNIVDSFTSSAIKNRVAHEIRRQLFSGSPFRLPKLNKGDFVVGFDINGQPILIPLQYLNAGCLEVANTGAGKTNRSRFWVLQIAYRCRGIWLVDCRKTEYRFLRPIFARMGLNLIIIRGRKFRINPLQVPLGVDPHGYAAQIADCLAKVLNLPPRAAILFRSNIIKLYKKNGVLSGSIKYPTLFHLFEAIRNDKFANPQARQSILDNLEAVLLSLGPEVLAYHKGWDVDVLAQHLLVLELTMLPESVKDLILNYLILAEFTSRIARGISNPDMNLFISFDEGQRLFSQKKESLSSQGDAIVDLAGLVRGTGIGLNVSALSTYDLSNKLPNLTANRIIGRCGSQNEYTTAGRFIGLNPEQINWCMHQMVPGLFVGQVSEGSWRYPFLFRVPLLNKAKIHNVNDGDADRSIPSLQNMKLLPAKI